MPVPADELARPVADRFRSMTLLELVWWASMAVAIAVLPFNSYLVLGDVNGFVITPLAVAVVVGIAAWLALLVRARRLPSVPALLVGGVALMIAASFLSAALAGGHNDEALRVARQGAAAALLFVALVDMVRGWREAAALAAVLVAAFTASAALGLVMLALPPEFTISFAEWDYTVAGARRLQASLGYPTTAAMSFEMVTFVALGLFGAIRTRPARAVLVVAIALLVTATLFTLSRGSVLGYAGGFAVLFLAALVSGRRRLALSTAVGAVALSVAVFAVQLVTVPPERLLTDSETGFYNATYEAPRIAFIDEEPAPIAVTVKNTGSAAWRAGQFQLGYHWLNSFNHDIVAFGQLGTDLGDVPPGEQAVVSVTVVPLDEPGRVIAWDVSQRGSEWFSERGVPVTVTHPLPRRAGSIPAPNISAESILLYPALLAEPDRAELWNAAIQMIREKPLLGVGPGTYRLRYGAYLGLERWDLDIHANNTYLEIGATTGVAGLAVFLFVTLYAIWRQLRHLVTRPTTPAWLLSAGLAAAAVAFAAHGMVDYFLGFTGTLGIFWAVLGIGLGLALRDRRASAPG